MWDKRNCLSFETVAGGIEPPSPRLTVRRSMVHPPFPTAGEREGGRGEERERRERRRERDGREMGERDTADLRTIFNQSYATRNKERDRERERGRDRGRER